VAFGLWCDRRAQIGDGVAYQRQMRDEWATIRMLSTARNTAEEAAAYAKLAGTLATDGASAADLRAPVVVSSASHLPRAIAEFQRQGLEPVAAPTAHRATPQRFALPGDFAPEADNLRTTEAAWHEFLGRLWARLRGRG
jgi:uncharacterized SAM-binding protein YcdF (DUF218 family)